MVDAGQAGEHFEQIRFVRGAVAEVLADDAGEFSGIFRDHAREPPEAILALRPRHLRRRKAGRPLQVEFRAQAIHVSFHCESCRRLSRRS